ncbi:NECA1 protein, partial [Certhia familiaris]|nr:NECA1 protein [Certhia familiaris]
DDGKLSFDEFKAYFADGVLSGELHELFRTIDTHNTDNLDTEELYYFSKHFGEYENVLSVLEDLNIAILKAKDKTKKLPIWNSLTRFLLKETLNQLQSLQNSLECAMETMEEQSQQESQINCKVIFFFNIKYRNSLCTSNLATFYKCLSFIFSKSCIEEDSQWVIQINKLQTLIDRLEKKEFRGRCVSDIVMVLYQHIMIVQHQMSVIEEKAEEFHLALKKYVESASAQGGCLHISILKFPSNFHFIVYEFWVNSNAWNSHLQMNYSKAFQRSNMDFLETPELITTMLVPGKYQLFTFF